jgi:LmbE family N-acetylglucosaminyl deacetylase
VEIAVGGTLLKMRDHGYSVVLCHASDGEPTPRGDRETRLAEARAAAALLGAELEVLSLRNRYIIDSLEARRELALVVRKHRPTLILSPWPAGEHPDHRAVAHLADAARFYAKLTKTDDRGEPWELPPWWAPDQLYYHLASAVEDPHPAFVVDITEEYPRKQELLACYRSQSNVDMDRLAKNAFWGELIGVRYGEAFFRRGGLSLPDLSNFLGPLPEPLAAARPPARRRPRRPG